MTGDAQLDFFLLCDLFMAVLCIAALFYGLKRTKMTEQFWVIGGEFSSLNFHNLDTGTAIIRGPYPQRDIAEDVWKSLSEQHRHRANYRFIVTTEKVP